MRGRKEGRMEGRMEGWKDGRKEGRKEGRFPAYLKVMTSPSTTSSLLPKGKSPCTCSPNANYCVCANSITRTCHSQSVALINLPLANEGRASRSRPAKADRAPCTLLDLRHTPLSSAEKIKPPAPAVDAHGLFF
ncbi:hypothetical protein DV096_11025 [Bradymonadaceae bacterium TMQ3]|nr:hypothetical protein DV096_11025 [Bradymonadaceae bacterium TMQ3]TXC76005.1 hypothetical protein FRC91_10935 [Bradymonadales bacterium TMQ1]